MTQQGRRAYWKHWLYNAGVYKPRIAGHRMEEEEQEEEERMTCFNMHTDFIPHYLFDVLE